MRRLLVVLTRPVAPLDERVLEAQEQLPDTRVETIDLRTEAPDYHRLLEAAFEADSVQVW